mgnify:CR=1 FL=1
MKTIAVTGGDASGKTDSWQRLPERLRNKILQVPEIATALMSYALPALGREVEVTPEIIASYQSVFRPAQLVAEDTWKMVAMIQNKKLVWCDRGIPDMVAYDPGGWPSIERAFKLTKQEIYDRYDHVINLRSLAFLDPDAYLRLMDSNPSRTPRSIQEATDLDERIYAAWKDHPGRIEIDCSLGIDAIVSQIETAIKGIITREIEKKYYLEQSFPDLAEFGKVVRVFQRQGYIVANSKGEIRVRRVAVENGPTSYVMTTKDVGHLERYEYEDEEYPEAGYKIAKESFHGHEIVKTRHICRRDGVIYEIDNYQAPAPGVIVEVNFDNPRQAEAFEAARPAWLQGAIDVTGIPGYKARAVAFNGHFPQTAEVV